MNRKDFQTLARIRLKEARVLLKAGCYDGAFYLAGYVIEFALKAVIAKQTARHDFPDKKRTQDSHTHEFTTLIRVADLREELDEERRTDPTFNDFWTALTEWSETARYATATRARAERLVQVVSDSKHAVFRWIRRFW